MRREESDGRVVPHGRRKAVPTAPRARGGKATTASERAGQRDLFLETADSPQGAVPGARTGQPAPRVRYAVPKSRHTPGVTLPAMTMEEVASDENLRRAFEEVAQNRGAPAIEELFKIEIDYPFVPVFEIRLGLGDSRVTAASRSKAMARSLVPSED